MTILGRAPDLRTELRSLFRAMRSRNYRLFFGGQIVSLVGSWMTSTATPWLVYRLTGHATMLGVVVFAGRFPAFALAPLAGVLNDRWNLRRVLVVTQTLAMVQSFLLFAVALALSLHAISGATTVELVIGLSIFQGLIDGCDMPARQAFVIQMVERREDLGNAIALNSSMVNFARMLGPTLAGVLIPLWGEKACFLLDGVSYIAVIASFLAMTTRPRPVRAVHPSVIHGLREGVAYAWKSPPIRTVLTMLALLAIMGMPYMAIMPVFAKVVFRGNARTLGWLMLASGCGALGGAVFLARRPSAAGLDRIMTGAAVGASIALMGFAFAPSLILALPMIVVIGFCMMIHMASGNTILQTIVDDDKRGRVMSLFAMAFMGALPFGALLFGKLADEVGAQETVLLGAIACLAAAVIFAGRRGVLTAAIHRQQAEEKRLEA